MRRAALLTLVAPLALAASSVPAGPVEPTIDQRLAAAQADAARAEQRAGALDAAAGRAGDEASRLAAQQQAAAAEIEAAEAKIALAQATVDQASGQLALSRQRLAAKRAPLAALLAGVATMGREPPILALAGDSSAEDMVRLRALLDTTMPWIAARSAALRAEVARTRTAAEAADRARSQLADNRALLDRRRARFAMLERQAEAKAQSLSGQAFGAEERVLAAGESVSDLGGEAAAAAAARALARPLAQTDFATPRPGAAAVPAAPIAYTLPAAAPVDRGLGAVDASGVVARGIRLATARGAALIVPAGGRILFAGPYRGEDGLIIIDHGGGWTSLLLGVATELPKGAAVERGQPLGRALGAVTVELRHNGTPVSAAVIASSSQSLSNGARTR